MKNKIIRVIAAVPGLVMLQGGVSFLINPEQQVSNLGMTLLDGVGRSTQLGDLAAFFIGSAVFIFMGAVLSKGRWLYAGAMLIGGAAMMRILAALVAGAEMATQFIVAELVMTAWLCACAFFVDKTTE
ncbi:MAG: hypothetical protein ABGY96_08050 [bacterium]